MRPKAAADFVKLTLSTFGVSVEQYPWFRLPKATFGYLMYDEVWGVATLLIAKELIEAAMDDTFAKRPVRFIYHGDDTIKVVVLSNHSFIMACISFGCVSHPIWLVC